MILLGQSSYSAEDPTTRGELLAIAIPLCIGLCMHCSLQFIGTVCSKGSPLMALPARLPVHRPLSLQRQGSDSIGLVVTACSQALRSAAASDDSGLHAMDGRKRIEQALPSLAAVAADPELSGRSPEIERGRRRPVGVQRG